MVVTWCRRQIITAGRYPEAPRGGDQRHPQLFILTSELYHLKKKRKSTIMKKYNYFLLIKEVFSYFIFSQY